jgi:hypothetical protein
MAGKALISCRNGFIKKGMSGLLTANPFLMLSFACQEKARGQWTAPTKLSTRRQYRAPAFTEADAFKAFPLAVAAKNDGVAVFQKAALLAVRQRHG